MRTTVLAVDLADGLSQAWSSIATFVPKLVLFLVILLIGWIIAKAIARVATLVLRKVGFDRAVERAGLSRILAQSQYDAVDLVAKVLYYFILLIALQAAFGAFPTNPISDIVNDIVAWLPKAAVAIVIVVVVAAIANVVRDLLINALSSLAFGRMLATLTAAFIIGLGVVAALNQIGVASFVTSSVLTAVLASVAGIAIVGVGGGLIRPMQERWSRWLGQLEEQTSSSGDRRDNPEGPGGSSGTY